MDAAPRPENPQELPLPASTPTKLGMLTIKTSNSSGNPGEKSLSTSPTLLSPQLKISPESSVYNSPSVISPPSSAFVSALQSPYISPRAFILPHGNETPPTLPSPLSYSGSHSDDIPSTSYTPPPERFDFSDDPADQKQKFAPCVPIPDPVAPRISFSFPVPRISFANGSVSPSSNAKPRGCDVYIGFHGQNLNLTRFCKWLKSELELQGIASFVADRTKYSDTQSHEIADRIICSATFGVIVITAASLLNHFSIEEIRFFTQKKNLIPLLFDTDTGEIMGLLDRNSDDKEWREAIDGLMKAQEFKLEAKDSNWRSCVSKAVGILKSKLGRKSVAEKKVEDLEEFPFPRNRCFVGREKELMEIETAFFGCNDHLENDISKPTENGGSNRSTDGFADEESETVKTQGKYISLEMRKCKEPTLEAWIEPVIDFTNKGRSQQMQRSKHKKMKNGGGKGYCNAGVFCINGISGIGKTELALEFAYRNSQRYKMVLWVGGEVRYFRQNLLNLSFNLGLDVSAETEKERGRIRSFDEQEFEAFQRVKRELFRDIPYLLIIDNLEAEKEWWEGKDLHDLIPRNTGATHVIVTTRLSKVMSFEPTQLQPLSLTEAMVLIKGKRKKDYPAEELDVLRKFDERLERLSFGLWVIGSLLSELAISPSALFEAINRVSIGDNPCSLSGGDDQPCSNPFLIKVLRFSFAVLDQTDSRRNLALRMVLAGAWFAPAPVSVTTLAAAAKKIPIKENGFHQWRKCLSKALCCCSNCCLASQTRKSESESALLLVKLGLARTANRQQPGCWIQFHGITQIFSKRKGALPAAKAMVQGVGKMGNPALNSDHLWASTFMVFGFKSEPPLVQLKAIDMVVFIKKTMLPLAIRSFTAFSRCSSALELLKVCTNVLEELEKSFVSQIQDWSHGSLCWKKKLESSQRVDEYVWQDVTLLKATLLETRAKLLLRGGHFDSGEELCRTCISIRTVMLGHNHAQTLAAQETLAKLVRSRSKM
ncbi:P-loop containing nucleoside triphosphate hydrolases superfamily protein [Tasmannia lanceolata]|uniref:P-loop containing nucleoside triphosphate hydrolases superfamily protein n=1 Tax=Tasmannia lanceolata TaxID=3420 RepID=UPI004062EA75